jgi:hypothetical protein
MPTKQREIYRNGQLITTEAYEISGEQAERDSAPVRLQQALARLRQIATQADEVAQQGANVNQTQLKGLFSATADLARAIRALVIREFDE